MNEERGRLASATGSANEHRLLGALLGRGYNASRVDLPLSTYDIVVELETGEIVRVQAKTVGSGNSVSFTGGTRGGVDRTYKSGVKSYVQSTQTSDIVVGVKSASSSIRNGDRVDFYFIPTLFIERLGQKSLSVNKIPNAKNRWDILEKCRNKDFVRHHFRNVIPKWPTLITLP